MTKVEIAMPQTGQLPQVKGPEINDRDLINDILAYEKYLTNGYNTGLNEMQMPRLHDSIQTILNNVHKSQVELFDLMFQKGWYKMKAACDQDKQQAYQQFSGYKTQFPNG
ncbi:spore coat protein [Paenibacillus sp. N1-5-1-14]|uniref:spore coat protein n=1 Tax=Paenibacillus radicibacter TaxID=2972488 RepID=UPI0021597896|nr:spore coat protein [Paenibacillus radicibacter]MCR8641843.1 spore coat protein [Paenibacillus radicibacter]